MKITSKKQLSFVLQADYMMNRGKFCPSLRDRIKGIFLPDYIMSYIVVMRRVSFHKNRGGLFQKLLYYYYCRKFNLLGIKLGFSIGCDVFGYGLRLPHYGTIVVGESNNIGNYALLHTSICISDNKKIIGDGLYCSTGVKMTSPLTLGKNISVGANSLVNNSYEFDNALIGGIPSKFIKQEKAWYVRDCYDQKVEKIEELRKRYGL